MYMQSSGSHMPRKGSVTLSLAGRQQDYSSWSCQISIYPAAAIPSRRIQTQPRTWVTSLLFYFNSGQWCSHKAYKNTSTNPASSSTHHAQSSVLHSTSLRQQILWPLVLSGCPRPSSWGCAGLSTTTSEQSQYSIR